MAKKPSKKQAPPTRPPDIVEVGKDDVDILLCAFDGLLSGNMPQLRAWFEDTGNEEEQLDQAMKRLGDAVGRTSGLL